MDETKHCPKCDRDKAIRHFHKDRSTKDGLCWCCKQCRRPLQAKASKRIAARKRAYQARYREENAEYIRARQRRLYWSDVETQREMSRIRAANSRARRKAAAQERTAA